MITLLYHHILENLLELDYIYIVNSVLSNILVDCIFTLFKIVLQYALLQINFAHSALVLTALFGFPFLYSFSTK